MKKNAIQVYGWYGSIAILLAYGLASLGLVQTNSYIYQLLNLTGALGIASISILKKARQPAVLNIIWAIIALIAIVSLLIS